MVEGLPEEVDGGGFSVGACDGDECQVFIGFVVGLSDDVCPCESCGRYLDVQDVGVLGGRKCFAKDDACAACDGFVNPVMSVVVGSANSDEEVAGLD